MDNIIQVTKSSMPNFEDFSEEIKDLWDTRWLTNMGKKHQKLESMLTNYLNVPYLSLFTNGHLALESIIQLFDLTGEVITTPFTFISTTHAIVRNDLTPVFCDINPDDYTIDTEKIKKLVTEKTSAIIPVHVYGNVCNITEIEQIAEEYNLKVIYDAAHTFGVKVNGKGIGCFGDASMFSFHATKVFNTIEGGAVTFKDQNFKSMLESVKNFGITSPETVDYIGTNAKMNEFQAAMGICNLKNIDSDIEKRKFIVERYKEHLDDLSGIKISPIQNGVESNYAYFPVLFDGFRYTRDEVHEYLKNNNIYTRKYFYPLTNSFNCYQNENYSGETPVAKYVADRILTLPLYADLSIHDVDRICNLIKNM